MKESELLAGKEQIKKLSMLLSSKLSTQMWGVCNKQSNSLLPWQSWTSPRES